MIADGDGYFTLADFQPHLAAMAEEKPNNPLIVEKIRQQLQILQHEGKVKFLVPGSYKLIPQATLPLLRNQDSL